MRGVVAVDGWPAVEFSSFRGSAVSLKVCFVGATRKRITKRMEQKKKTMNFSLTTRKLLLIATRGTVLRRPTGVGQA